MDGYESERSERERETTERFGPLMRRRGKTKEVTSEAVEEKTTTQNHKTLGVADRARWCLECTI